MRGPLQGVLVAWTAVTIFSVLLATVLYFRQRERQYLAFGILGTGSAAFTMAAAFLYGSEDAAAAAFWLKVEFAVGTLATVGLFLFNHELLARPRDRVTRWMVGLTAVGLPGTLAGVLVDPGESASPRYTWVDLGHLVLPAVTWTYYLYTAMGIAAVAFIIREVLRADHGGRRIMAVATGVYGLGWCVDTFLRVCRIESPFVTEHCVFVSSLLMSYLLLDRFIRTGSELEQRTHELAQSYEELRQVEEELVRKEQLAAVGELSAVIAHEVRNPLAVLRNAVSGLRREELGAEDRATLLEVLDEETNRLNRLVRDLLVYARPVDPQSVELDLQRVLERAIDLARRDHTRTAIVRVDVDHSVAAATAIEGDPDLLERAFANVVENALQAMPDGGRLTIRLDKAELAGGRSAVAISFSDTGEGMDTLVRSRARDPFFTTRSSGTGLGLAIVERAIGAHGGEVVLESGSEDGTTVTLVVPTRPRAPERG